MPKFFKLPLIKIRDCSMAKEVSLVEILTKLSNLIFLFSVIIFFAI